MRMRVSRSLLCTLLILILAAGGLLGCAPEGGEETAEPQEDEKTIDDPYGGSVSVAISDDPENMNPLLLPTALVRRYIVPTIYNGLVRANAELEWVSDLAEDWSVSEDQRTVTFYLREDVTFHDGEPMTAEDVAFTLESMAHPDYHGGQFAHVASIAGAQEYRDGEADGVAGIEVVDEHTIAITTERPDAAIFTTVSNQVIGVLPKHVLGDVPPDEWQRHEQNHAPIGTGPFKFVDREADSHIELVAFEDYWEGRPYLDRLTLRIGDPQTMFGAFMNEEIDVIEAPVDEKETAADLPFARVHIHEGGSFNYIGLNNLHPPFEDPRVRQAIATALNVEQITNTATRGLAESIIAPMIPSSWAYPDQCEGWPYDPERAAEMLDEAGWEVNSDGIREKDGIEMSFMWHNADRPEANRIAALVQQNLQDVHIEIDIQVVDFTTMTHILMPRDSEGIGRAHTADDYHMYTLGLSVRPDPQSMERQFHSEMMSPAGHNYVSYANERVDELWEKMRHEMEFTRRREYAQELYGILCREVPWIPLYATVGISVAHESVRGFEPNVLGQMHNVVEWRKE